MGVAMSSGYRSPIARKRPGGSGARGRPRGVRDVTRATPPGTTPPMVNDVTPERLQRLTAHRDSAVLSLFLDLDPSLAATAPARQSAVDSLLSDARAQVEDRKLSHDDRIALREAIGELQDQL